MKQLVKLLLSCLLLSLALTTYAQASVNASIISEIESSNNPNAFNARSGARGLFQITPICLKHFNDVHGSSYSSEDLFQPLINKRIGEWYLSWLSKRCATNEEILISYNFGYGNMKKWKAGKIQLPQETKEYLLKYSRLENRKAANG